MPKPRFPFLNHEQSRHGRMVWYFRRGKGPRIRIDAEFGTPEFEAAYRAALAGDPPKTRGAGKAHVGTLAWLLERHRDSTAWGDLSTATRRQRENIYRQVMAKAGAERAEAINQKSIAAGRDARKDTPAQARVFLDAMRGLFRWAHDAGLVAADPTAGVKNPKKRSGPGFPVWTEEDVAAYERRWPLGTKERVWLAVLLYTGLRRGDAVRLGRQHVRSGVATLVTEKTGQEVTLPLLPELLEALRAGPTGDLAFICGERGGAFTKESFGNVFKDACRAAGLPARSAHGVRKIGATRAADNGATVAQLEAIFGWSGGGMAALYTRAADRRRLAIGAMEKLSPQNKTETQSPAPSQKVRA